MRKETKKKCVYRPPFIYTIIQTQFVYFRTGNTSGGIFLLTPRVYLGLRYFSATGGCSMKCNLAVFAFHSRVWNWR